MPLHIVRASCNASLWAACADRFLAAAERNPGPTGHRAHLWLTHRNQRDLLFEQAVRRGIAGWLKPPIRFFSGLPELFGIRGKPIGLLARRELVSRIGCELGGRYGIRMGNTDATITRGNMMDAFVGELLPDGIAPDELERALEVAASDEFAERRNAWVVATYRRYTEAIEKLGVYDPRSIHALVAERIEAGELSRALESAEALHIYGVYSMRARSRLLRALAAQSEVQVALYTCDRADDLAALAATVEDLPATARPEPIVQPSPDAQRELHWVAAQVKDLVLRGAAEPHEIAVVARTGFEDTRRALQVLERAGIPATARVRSRLSEIGALRALLDLYRAAAERWSYRVLRNVLNSPYFRFRIDIRPFDEIATRARPTTLEEWEQQLVALLRDLERADHARDAARIEASATVAERRRTNLRAERVAKDLVRFRELRAKLEPLSGTRPLGAWIESTEALLRQSWFRFRQRICDTPELRTDVVRFDQRGVRLLEALLAEWRSIDDPTQPLSGLEWFRALRTLLEGQELVLTTPGQKGVQILEAHDAALLPFKASFVIHANDGEFPRSPTISGLFSDEERTALRGAGLPVEDRRAMLEREQVLWYAVTGVDPLHITYRTTDARGTPLLPSLLVPAHDEASELPRSTELAGPPLNIEQAGRAAAAQLPDGPVATPDAAALKRAIVNAFAEHTRRNAIAESERPRHSPWNGHLRDPRVLERLAAKFNEQYVWSASQLQAYTNVPFLFLLERVLGLRDSQEAEEDTTVLTSGGIAHEILERFYGNYLRQPAPSYEAAEATFFEIAGQVFYESQQNGMWLGEPALWEQRRLWLFQTLAEFVNWDLSKLGKAQVWAVEHEIGDAKGGIPIIGRDVLGHAAQMLVRGRIDRIDQNASGELTVIDYKSGAMPQGKTGYRDGAVLQGPLYIAALHAQGHTEANAAKYRSLKKRGNGGELKLSDPEFTRAIAIALSVSARVRAGHFEAVMATSANWQRYHPDRAIRRTDAKLAEGSRFDD